MFYGVLFPEADNKNFKVNYDRDNGLYNVAYFNNGYFVDECKFNPYREDGAVKWVYVVYGWEHNDSGEIVEEWVEAIFDNEEQADACVEYLHFTKSRKYFYFVGNKVLQINELDYIEKLNKLKEST